MSRIRSTWAIVTTAALLGGLAGGAAAQSDPSAEPAVETSPASMEPAPLMAPPEVEGIDWDYISVRGGAEIEADEEGRDYSEWVVLLEGTGASYERTSQLNAAALDPETGDSIGGYSEIRIVDADEGLLRAAFLDVFRLAPGGDEYVIDEAEISGKAVVVITGDVDQEVTAWVSGDTVHMTDLSGEKLEALLAALS
jgi:hypothetical protein